MRRCRMTLLLLAVLFAMLAQGTPCHARLVEDWPYDKLLKAADLVVIGKAVTAADSGEKTTKLFGDIEFVGVNTTFTVRAVLKGEWKKDKLTLFHYRAATGEAILNGPGLVQFRTGGVTLRIGKTANAGRNSEYLLFLKRRVDGRFEAVSGQVDPDGSVREMFEPLPVERR